MLLNVIYSKWGIYINMVCLFGICICNFYIILKVLVNLPIHAIIVQNRYSFYRMFKLITVYTTESCLCQLVSDLFWDLNKWCSYWWHFTRTLILRILKMKMITLKTWTLRSVRLCFFKKEESRTKKSNNTQTAIILYITDLFIVIVVCVCIYVECTFCNKLLSFETFRKSFIF